MTREAHTEALLVEAREASLALSGSAWRARDGGQELSRYAGLIDRLAEALAPCSPSAPAVDYVLRYGGRCRGCADEAGVCPMSGLPCDGARKVVEWVVGALEYGIKHGYTTLDALAARLAITPEREAIIAEIIAAMHRTSANVVYPIEPEDGDEPDEHLDMFSGYLSPRHVGTLADAILALTGKAETP